MTSRVDLTVGLPEAKTTDRIERAKRLGFTGTNAVIHPDMTHAELEEVRREFSAADIEMVQASYYVNLVSTDDGVRNKAIRDLVSVMNKAGDIGVRTVVTGTGHRDPAHPGAVFSAHRDNYSDATFDLLVATCETIVETANDDAAPLSVEPWVMMPLNSIDRAEELCQRVNHPKLMILLDPVNLMDLDVYFNNGTMIIDAFERLGERISVVHAKDTLLDPARFTYHLREVPPGKGTLDYPTLLRCLAGHTERIPLVIEHLDGDEDIAFAKAYIESIVKYVSSES